jgi:hypothetical protein
VDARRVTALANALVAAGDDTIRAAQDLRELEPANSARRLNTRFGLTRLTSEMYRAPVPLVGSDGVRRLVSYPICLPHEWLNKSYDMTTVLPPTRHGKWPPSQRIQ